MSDFSHLIQLDESCRRVVIYRIFDDGRKELFTAVDLPSALSQGSNEGAFDEFARLLGENLLLDSPIARRLLGL